jgi:glycerophosphoryl diester phosphodiesterase
MGVDALEMDVHATRDGVLVVNHDDTVDRTTDGSGAIACLSLKEIKALDAGYNWPHHEASDERPFRGAGLTIPTLEEVLSAFPSTPMVIDMKQADPPIVRPFGEMLRRFGRSGNTIAASFHLDTMRLFRKLFPEFATSGAPPEVRRFFVLNKICLGRLFAPEMVAFQVPPRLGILRVVTPRFIRVARRKGIAVHVWTINEADEMRELLRMGVAGIITDRPDLLLDVAGR